MTTGNRVGALDADKLLELASWYREFAERAASSVREARLRFAEDLEKKAELLEQVPKPLAVPAIDLHTGRS